MTLRTDTATDGVSPVVGVILMVAVTVILSTVVGAFVFNLGGQTNEPLTASVQTTTHNHSVDVQVLGFGTAEYVLVKHGQTRYFMTDVGDSLRLPTLGQPVTVLAQKDGRRTVLTKVGQPADFSNTLLTNPSFESDAKCDNETTGWTYVHDSSHDSWRVSDTAADGSLSFGQTSAGGSMCSAGDPVGHYPNNAVLYQNVSVSGQQTLLLSANLSIFAYAKDDSWHKTLAPREPCPGSDKYIYEDDGRLKLTAYNQSGSVIAEKHSRWVGQVYEYSGKIGRNWHRIGLVFETPPGTDTVRVTIQGGEGGRGSSCSPDGQRGNAATLIDDVRLTIHEDD